MKSDLSPEQALIEEIGFDEEILTTIKKHTDRKLGRAVKYSELQEISLANALSIEVPNGNVAEELINSIQLDLLARGYRAFWSTVHEPNGLKRSDEVVILRSTDDLEIVRLRSTNGSNYDVLTNDIIGRLQDWKKLCEFTVAGAACDWIALTFQSIPNDICNFAAEVYLFCPDSVEQGVGLQREMDYPDKFAAALTLCPEVPASIIQKEEEQRRQIEAMRQNPRFAQLLDSLKNEGHPSTSMGVRLLACEIRTRRYLFLWWD